MEILLDLNLLFIDIQFPRNFARHSDQFRGDFCWTGLIFYGFSPRSGSYFED